ncbi:ATP synthase subunit I [Roseovarius sp. SCSIO 43702]|uniref:ATP synthase subunit I n=1 Tax=Roseovarius sp. SCSIO 43702 TaxID=2823043 RepID=UPI001C736539|nr:ATP synthase subunit I [Roseovarius sp. SCSIO 43702]QYX55968.1 ATP synthase subunit I [Roseovarius sp. SCSIO 43702]
MIESMNWTLLAIGALAGSASGALYFAGLAWGMRLALRRARPAAVLMTSAAIRIALLLAAGWAIAQLGAAAIVGFALAFVVLRFLLVSAVRTAPAERIGS